MGGSFWSGTAGRPKVSRCEEASLLVAPKGAKARFDARPAHTYLFLGPRLPGSSAAWKPLHTPHRTLVRVREVERDHFRAVARVVPVKFFHFVSFANVRKALKHVRALVLLGLHGVELGVRLYRLSNRSVNCVADHVARVACFFWATRVSSGLLHPANLEQAPFFKL